MRKKILLVIICIAAYSLLVAQSITADSLRTLLLKHPQKDTAQINLMIELAKEFRKINSKSGDSLADIAISLSDQLNYAKGKGNALAVKGAIYSGIMDHQSAKKAYEEAEQILKKVNDKHGLAYLFRMRARLLMDEGNYAQSLDEFIQGIKLAQETGDIKTVVDIEGTVGYLYNILGDYAKAIPYQTDALKLAESIGYKTGMSGAYNAIGKTYKTKGDYPESLDAYTKGLYLDESRRDSANIAIAHGNIGDVYERMGNYRQSFNHIRIYLNYHYPRPKTEDRIAWGEWVLGKAFLHSGNADSGLYYGKHSLMLADKVGFRLYLKEITQLIAESAASLKKWDTAYKYQVLSAHYKDSLLSAETSRKTAMLQASFDLDKKQAQIALLTKGKELQMVENRRERLFLYALLGGLALVLVLAVVLFRNNRQKQRANILLHKQKKEIDNKAQELSVQRDNLEQSYKNIELMGEVGRKITSSLSVGKIISTVYDNVNSLMDASVFGIGIYNDALKRIEFPATHENGQPLPFYSNSIYDENRFDVLCYRNGQEIIMGDLGEEYKNYIQNIQAPKAGDQTVSIIYLPLMARERVLGVITVQSFQKNAYSDYHLFMLRNIAIYAAIALENAEAFEKLNQTLTSLKKAQTQLIQAEKMASLGELTAGIAHEIQNPLNFVNNFSEVNTELIEEMEQEIDKGNLEEVKAITQVIKENAQKINHHGKRADAIVKGMLQHSRSSSGQKELTDINVLADEYLRLSYHGLRAKDKSFNATFRTDFDEKIQKVNVVPQDIGRVILNLFTNAFYSVTEKKKQLNGEFEPIVSVTTKMVDDKVEIRVKDNGVGIPQKILDKIYQPFFTTKPGGHGTGLGLSISYDIITKGHGGQMIAETKEGEFAEFIIQLPIA
jgi:signal transduction histidine kinase/tetratricopeptide (TPR) repeat protein